MGNQHHGARAALAFRATLLCARQALCANMIEQRGLNARITDGNTLIVEQESRGVGTGGLHFPPLYMILQPAWNPRDC